MVIKDILAQLKTSEHPVARALHKGEHFKVIVLAFKKGMALKEHTTHLPAKLTVLSGSVQYTERTGPKLTLGMHDTTDIPVNIPHAVEALDDSLCLLTQG